MEKIWKLRDQNHMSVFMKMGTITQMLPVIALLVIQAHVDNVRNLSKKRI